MCAKAAKSHLAKGPVGEETGIWKRFRQALILVESFGGGQAHSGSRQSREGARMGSVLAPKHQKTYLRLHDQNIHAAFEFPS